MTLRIPFFSPTREQLQRRFGAILLCISVLSIVLDATGLSSFPSVESYLLLTVLAVIALAVRKTERGLTSLVGLLFLSTLLFNAAEPIYASLTGDSSIYTISFGTTVEPDGRALFHLLTFWTVGIAAVFGGYFLVFSSVIASRKPLNPPARTFCKQAFFAAFAIVAILIPMTLHSRLVSVISGGYTALYLDQAKYSFGLARLVDFLCPLLYSLAVLIDEKRYSRMMLVAVLCYTFTGIVVGQRMEAGCWLFVMLWHRARIRGKSLGIAPLALALVVTAIAFQLVDTLRGGTITDRFILIQYVLGQGITFLLPALSWTLPSPPIHSIFGSLLPLGGLYHVTGVGSAADSSLGSYICSQSNPLLFESGYGLGSSCYIEIFYLCGGVMLLYAIACGFFGFLLRKWEEGSTRNSVSLFLLCISLSSLFSLPRGSLNAITSQIFYDVIFIVFVFLITHVFSISRSNTGTEVLHGAS